MRIEAPARFEALAPRLPGMDVMGQHTNLTLRRGRVLLSLQRLSDAVRAVAPMHDRPVAVGVRGQALLCGPVVLVALADARWGSLLPPASARRSSESPPATATS